MTAKRTVLIEVLVAAVVLLACSARTWVEGTVSDVVLQDSTVSVSGSKAAAGVVAGALVGAAAAVATATGGRIVRWVGAIAALLAGLLAVVLTLRVILDPSDVVGRQAATTTGRTGSVEADGSVTVWVWIALVGALLLLAAGASATVGMRRWAGLSSRYDAPTADKPARQESDWERLSKGEDPTADADVDAADPPR
ncbi:Trp biosynthesis-associated membrane protein [Luteipulveratus mongoliensis]|uniref:Trp biosynthesis associated, transmembrane protein, Oprn/Chp n=1 Tax=Luteipulveratus mongoliensis TaxID=571913 RepID=A0A0K1JJK2_9MICO|nr:Trp biosynthesis-associated membrane protein [Luteipulveratus mongoliensis]AKU16750.1 hypothetical protein VV02_14200 [Luteipulveratus mongoliensis]